MATKTKMIRRVVDDTPRKPDVPPHIRRTLDAAPKGDTKKRTSKKGGKK